MSEQGSSEAIVFDVPSPLRERLGTRDRTLEIKVVARAEAALVALSANFDGWLLDDFSKLNAARDAMLRQGVDEATIDRLFTHALDLKSLGTTYGFPLVTRFAASLCKLLGDGDTELQGPLPLVDAHIAAIKASIRDKVRKSDDPAGAALATELERQTAAPNTPP